MIRALRVRHRRMVTGLALLLPLGMVAALSARAPPLDPLESGAHELAPDEVTLPEVLGDFGTFEPLPLTARLGRDHAGRTVLELRPGAALLAPDLLVYWSPQTPDAAGAQATLLEQGVLLGRLGEHARRFVLPVAGAARGAIVLHDLARGETVAVRAVPELTE